MPKDILSATAAAERMELYCIARPSSPSAVHHPQLSIRCGVWVALFGESVRDGIAGFGATVESALGAFDEQYLKATRAPKPETAGGAISRNQSKAGNGLWRAKTYLPPEMKGSPELGVETLHKPSRKKWTAVRPAQSNHRRNPNKLSKSVRQAEGSGNPAILAGRLLRRKRLLLAALRVWELKHRV